MSISLFYYRSTRIVFLFLFFYFFHLFFLSCRLITLQYCSGFCHTLTWISHGFTCIPHPDPSSHLPLHLILLGLLSAPAPSMITLYAKEKKRHRCTEETFGLCGRRWGWDAVREQNGNVYIIKGETDHQPRLDAWCYFYQLSLYSILNYFIVITTILTEFQELTFSPHP